MIRCEKCGTWIDPGQKFCTSCGTPLKVMNQDLFPNDSVRRGTVVNGKPIEGAGANKGLLVLAAAAALIGAVLGGWYWLTAIPLSALPRAIAANPQTLLSLLIAVPVPVAGAVFYLAAGNNRRSAMVHALLFGVLSAARTLMTLYMYAKNHIPMQAAQTMLMNMAVLLVIAALMAAASAGSRGSGAAVVAAVLSVGLILYQVMPVISRLRLNMPNVMMMNVSTFGGVLQVLAIFFAALALMIGGQKKEPVYGWG